MQRSPANADLLRYGALEPPCRPLRELHGSLARPAVWYAIHLRDQQALIRDARRNIVVALSTYAGTPLDSRGVVSRSNSSSSSKPSLLTASETGVLMAGRERRSLERTSSGASSDKRML